MSAWNLPPPTYDASSTSYVTTTLTPYLQLPHLLSLTWLAYPILSLLFVAFRLQLSLASAQDAAANAKESLLASCKAAEQAATSAASMPRFLAIASNKQFADAVNDSMNAARAALVLALTCMEAIINFIVDMYRSTLLCFIELVVRGGLAILISAVQEVNSLLQSVGASLSSSIKSDITSANSAITTAINAINKVNPFGNITPPQINVPSLSSLENITIPASFEQALISLNASIPSVADLKNSVEDIIDKPFELVKQDINETFGNLTFDQSVLPVPQLNTLTFCNDLDLSVVDDIKSDLIKTFKIGVVILILLALLLVGLNCLLTWYKWRCMKNHLEYTRQAWTTDPTMYHPSQAPAGAPQITLSDHNLMMLNADSSHPLITRIVNQMSMRFRLSPSQNSHMHWFFNYIFHPPALACFLIGFFGLLSIQIQLLAMGPLVAKYQERANTATTDFSNTIATSINASMYNQSASYANDVNGRVDVIQTTINDGLFGWVNGTTTTLNTTVVNFYNDVQNAVSTVFNGTILESPAQEFIKCFIGSKVDAIENVLTFLKENLVVDMPRVNQSVLVLSPASVNEATQPIAAAAIGGGDNGKGNNNGGIIMRLVNSYAESLKKERIMFAIFLALWGFVVIMGICVLLWHSYGKGLVEKRKRKKWEAEQRSGIDGLIVPFRVEEQPATTEKGGLDLPSFTPLPSPKFGSFKPFSFSRSTSPAVQDEEQSSSTEALGRPADHRNGWDNFFGRKQGAQLSSRAISKPNKLMAIGRKAMGKELLQKDREPSLQESTSTAEQSGKTQNTRNTAWFGRVANMLGKKDSDAESVNVANNLAGHGRPPITIEVERASSDFDRNDDDSFAYDRRANQSRWSASPDATQTTTPWIKSITPSRKAATPPQPPIGVPIRAPFHKPSVPSDVGSSYDDGFMNSLKPSPLAAPLHHGFNDPQPPSRPRKRSSPPPPLNSPRIYQPQNPLAAPPRNLIPPPDWHRRSSSVPSPSWTATAHGPLNGMTAATRLLTTTHARQSSTAVDPFVTPFDDEHRVRIEQPRVDARKSIPTNPFIVL